MKKLFLLTFLFACLTLQAQIYRVSTNLTDSFTLIIKQINAKDLQISTLKDQVSNLNYIESSLTKQLTDCRAQVPVTPPVTPPIIADYYVSPTGSDNNPGTFALPFKSVEKAYSMAAPGKLFYFRGGVYKANNPGLTVPIFLANGINGTASAMIKFWAYPGETPIIDLSSLNHTGETVWGIQFTGDYWYWKGFEIKGFPAISWKYVHETFVVKNSNNCIFENLIIHDNKAMGFDLTHSSNNNLIKNCDAYNNQDSGTTTDPYGNADGFHFAYLDAGTVNTIQGCRSWYNSDDGYDCYGSDGKLVFDNCWAFNNGYQIGTTNKAGDGAGFKLGGTVGSYTAVLAVLTNCIAIGNRQNGFDQNDGVKANQLIGCISANNGGHGIYMQKYNEPNVLTNCISVNNGSGYNALLTPQSTVTNCSWKSGNTLTIKTYSTSGMDIARKDNALPILNF